MNRSSIVISLIIVSIITIVSCKKSEEDSAIIQAQEPSSNNLIQYVNPMIGTKNMGHTFPGATTPFGMVQLSPETNQEPMHIDGEYNPETYRYCSGYQYDDSTIFGF